ncbi:MAG: alanine racemase [Bacteroidales bacterium]|nr:alanine racemase [Bacteroidales bacterium]
MSNSSLITINEQALKKNIRFLRRKMGAKPVISAVVKANAYGHGIEQIVPLFEESGINHFSVFDFNEALRVYQSLSKPCPIMIMGWVSDEDLEVAIQMGIEFYVFTIDRLEKALELARDLDLRAKIHLEAETGMNRSGLNTADLKLAVKIISEHTEHFIVKGFCTHLAGAESVSNYYRIQKQIKKYNKMLSVLTDHNIQPEIKHMANSAAAFVYPKTRMDLVRIGIMLYGFWSSAEVFIHYVNHKVSRIDPLDRILGWESRIMAIKEITTGEFVSYGISYMAQSDIKTALIPVGYSSGYNRSLSNKGRVLIGGQFCGIIGVVNMNMIIADITNVPDTQIGDEVILIGKQGEQEIKVSAFSDISDQLNYEVLAHLSSRIKRIVLPD